MALCKNLGLIKLNFSKGQLLLLKLDLCDKNNLQIN